MLKKIVLVVAAFVLIATYGFVVRATIMDAVCFDRSDRPLPAETWSFDYDLQVVTLTVSIYDISHDQPDPSPPHFVWVAGTQDSQSVFTVIENIVNETGDSLTGYNLYLSNTVADYSEIVVGTVEATGSPEVRREDTHRIELAWSEPIPDGGVFTIQFDILNFPYHGEYFRFGLSQAVVPEPATITLLGFAGLALLRTRRSVRSQHNH